MQEHSAARALAALAAAFFLSAAQGAADPVAPQEAEVTCGEFLAKKSEGQLAIIRSLLAYDELGFDIYGRGRPVERSALAAVRLARERCDQDRARTVYHALGGTTPRHPYGVIPEGSG